MTKEVFIVDASRTPFLKVRNRPNLLSAVDLAIAAIKPLLDRNPLVQDNLDELIVSCVEPGINETHIGRVIAKRLNCNSHIMGWAVQRSCASGLQVIDSAFKDLMLGRHDLILAGGTEAISRAPWMLCEDIVHWLTELKVTKSIIDKIKYLAKFKPKFLMPVVRDFVSTLCMGQAAEKIVYDFNITREEMDQFAIASHFRAFNSIKNNYYNNFIVPLFDWQGIVIEKDNSIKIDNSLEKLSKLPPIVDKPFGKITKGNSAQMADGAAFLLLASRDMLRDYDLQPIAKVCEISWATANPNCGELGSVHAIKALLDKQRLNISDIDYWEINETYAVEAIACAKTLGIDINKINIDGGAIALGNPISANGVRIVLNLMNILKRNNMRKGIASICIGGYQGGALLLENTSEGV